MPATNCPSAASFSDCNRRFQLLTFGLEARLRCQIPGNQDVADAPVPADEIGDGYHERSVEHRVDDFSDRRRPDGGVPSSSARNLASSGLITSTSGRSSALRGLN
jgi:hypothetical protein